MTILLLVSEDQRNAGEALAVILRGLESMIGRELEVATDAGSQREAAWLERIRCVVLLPPPAPSAKWSSIVDALTALERSAGLHILRLETAEFWRDMHAASDASERDFISRSLAIDLADALQRALPQVTDTHESRHRGVRLFDVFRNAARNLYAEKDRVVLSAFAPELVRRGSTFPVRAVIHRERDLLDPSSFGEVSKGLSPGSAELARGTKLEVSFHVDRGNLEGPANVDAIWTGTAIVLDFHVRAPDALDVTIRGLLEVGVSGCPMLRAAVAIRTGPANGTVSAHAESRAFRSAFISYAHEDRGEALRIAQALNLVGTSVFVDVVELRLGQDWAERLVAEVRAREAFVLCWSQHTKRSDWVAREYRAAIAERIPIHPVWMSHAGQKLELPAELSHLQARDKFSSLIELEEYRRLHPSSGR